jgi:hypothetical protein
MPLSTLINTPCTIVRRSESGSTDSYGNDVPMATETETVCELQQVQRQERDLEGETSDTIWTLFFLPDVALHTGDAVEIAGEVYEITGEPWRARSSRTQAVEHVEATARRTAGAGDEVGS